MSIYIRIETVSEAFSGDNYRKEASRILRNISDRIKRFDYVPPHLFDSKGQVVGEFLWTVNKTFTEKEKNARRQSEA